MKEYIKPELFYERYELSQHIADCQWELTSANKNDCAASADKNYWGEWAETLFTEVPRCSIDDEVWQDYCYQAGAEGSAQVFAS